MESYEKNNLLTRNRWIVGVTAVLALAAIILAVVYTNDARERYDAFNRDVWSHFTEEGMIDREAFETVNRPARVFYSVNDRFLYTVLFSSQLIFSIILLSFPVRRKDGEQKQTAEQDSDGNAEKPPGVEQER